MISFADETREKMIALTNKIATSSKYLITFDRYEKLLEKLKKAETEEGKKLFSQEEIKEAQRRTNSFLTGRELDLLPPAKAVPELFQLFESDEFTDCQLVVLDGSVTNAFSQWVYEWLLIKMGTHNTKGGNNEVTLTWLHPEKTIGNSDYSALFWYYAGLKHFDTIWEAWYSCWKREQKRTKPRPEAIERLARELSSCYSYHVFPYVYKAIKAGDKTLDQLIEYLPQDGGFRFPSFAFDYNSLSSVLTPEMLEKAQKRNYFHDTESFLKFWEEKKDDFLIPPPKKSLEDLAYICKRKYPPVILSSQKSLNRILQAKKNLEEYCPKEEQPPTNTWDKASED